MRFWARRWTGRRTAPGGRRAEGPAGQAGHRIPQGPPPLGLVRKLVLGERFQVKRKHVNPGAALSLQSHRHRDEHWIVV